MAYDFSLNTKQSNVYREVQMSNNSSMKGQHSMRPSRSKDMHVYIIEPNHENKSEIKQQQNELQLFLQRPIISNENIIPIDDYSNDYVYESHLPRFSTNIIVVSARHPHSFYLQTVNDLTHIDNFLSKMNEFYNHCCDAQRLTISKAALRLNLCCVVRDQTESDVWNRAQLLEYNHETDQCSLLLVDLGTWQECVPRSDLRHILVPFRNECVRSVACRLAGIAPAKPDKNGFWNEYAIKTFRSVIDNVPTEVEMLYRSPNGSYFVNLFVTQDVFVCVNDFLLYHKIAVPADDCRVLKPKEFDPRTHEPLLAIIYEFNVQGELLAEKLKANKIKQKEEQKRMKEQQKQDQRNCRLPCIRIIDIPLSLSSAASKKLIFARYNTWIMIPSFSISILFDPPLSEHTIERSAMLYKLSPVYITPMTNATLFADLEKSIKLIDFHRETIVHVRERKIALYSIDCVRKLLLNHNNHNDYLFERLDEARQAEMKDDSDFWEISCQNKISIKNHQTKQSNTKSAENPFPCQQNQTTSLITDDQLTTTMNTFMSIH